MQKLIFVVDDSDTNLAMADKSLKLHYNVMTLPSADKLFALLKKLTPDLILLDIEMPGIDGFEAMKRLKADNLYAGIPVMFLTGKIDTSNEAYGIELGAVDFIRKPFSGPALLNRIKYHLQIDAIIHERTAELLKLQNCIVFAMADLVEGREKNANEHITRTAQYTEMLTSAMLEQNVYSNELSGWNLETFVSATRLHDIGKIIIPGEILNKRGPLTDGEFQIVKTHTLEGERIIERLIKQSGDIDLLNYAKMSAAFHHERWDGGGYPYGLKQAAIPLEGRIVAVADVYDALVSQRPYKRPISPEDAVDVIQVNAGKQFDPDIVNVFLGIKDQMKAAAQKNVMPHNTLNIIRYPTPASVQPQCG